MFFITCFTKAEKNELGYPNIGESVTVGFVEQLHEAGHLLKNNTFDLWEGIYDYVVIEEIQPGLYNFPEDRCFFQYDINNGRYYPIEEPENVKQIAVFAFL